MKSLRIDNKQINIVMIIIESNYLDSIYIIKTYISNHNKIYINNENRIIKIC